MKTMILTAPIVCDRDELESYFSINSGIHFATIADVWNTITHFISEQLDNEADSMYFDLDDVEDFCEKMNDEEYDSNGIWVIPVRVGK